MYENMIKTDTTLKSLLEGKILNNKQQNDVKLRDKIFESLVDKTLETCKKHLENRSKDRSVKTY